MSSEASFSAVSRDGDLLFEIISMDVSETDLTDFRDSVDLIQDMLVRSLSDSHWDFEILENNRIHLEHIVDPALIELELGDHAPLLAEPNACRRMVCTYSDRMNYTQDSYIMNRYTAVICCNFKVVSTKYKKLQSVFRSVANTVRIGT